MRRSNLRRLYDQVPLGKGFLLKMLPEMSAAYPSHWEWAGAQWRLKEIEQAEHLRRRQDLLSCIKAILAVGSASKHLLLPYAGSISPPSCAFDHHRTIWFL